MLTFRFSIVFTPALLLMAGCSPQEKALSVEDFQKPENAAALQKALSTCNLVLQSDPRAATCAAAHQAKFALDAQEIGRIRREQLSRRNEQPAGDDGVTVVEKTPASPARDATSLPAGRGESYRAELEPGR